MNKNFYRIVFNAARGMRMVVQETAMSAGKATGATAAVAVTALASMLVPVVASAQIAGALNVSNTLRPTVLVAPNGVPLVNIRTPSAAGVSRNVYNQFDVGTNGAILNNSRTTTSTQLGGYVQGNPYLATGPARVILNEINSGNYTSARLSEPIYRVRFQGNGRTPWRWIDAFLRFDLAEKGDSILEAADVLQKLGPRIKRPATSPDTDVPAAASAKSL